MTSKVRMDFEAHGTRLVEREIDRMGDSAERTSKDFDKLGKDAGHLEKRTGDLREEVAGLIKEFDKTGDTALLKRIKDTNRELGQLDRLKKQLGKLDSGDSVAGQAVEAGTKAGNAARKGFIGSLSDMGSDMKNAMGAAKGPAIAGAVVLAAAVAPFVGGVIASAVLGAAGTGGIIGGIVAAAQDQRVQQEAKRVADHVGSALTDAGAPFVAPLIESLRLLDDAGDRLASNFQDAGTKIAPVLVPLTKGLTGFVDEFMPGFVRSMEAAKPVIRAIANELPEIGQSLSDFFDTISEDPDGAIMAFKALSQIIQGTIRFTGELISALSKAFEATQKWGIGALDTVADVAESLQYLGPAFGLVGQAAAKARDNYQEQVDALNRAKDASGDFVGDGLGPIIRAEEEVAKVTKTATQAIDDQVTAMDKMLGRFLDPKRMLSEYLEALDDLTESVKENGKHFGLNTEAGRKNQEAIDNAIEKIKNIRNETIKQTGDVQAANDVYYEQVEALRQQAISLGMSKNEANELAAALRDIPRQAEVEVRAPGLLEALARARELNRLMGGIASGARARAAAAEGRIDDGYGGGRAGGGPMAAGKWYTVGENGVEVVAMNPGGGAMVYNSKQTGAMMSGASGGSSVAIRQPSMTLVPSGDVVMDALVRALWPYILKQVRFDGGDLTAFGAAA